MQTVISRQKTVLHKNCQIGFRMKMQMIRRKTQFFPLPFFILLLFLPHPHNGIVGISYRNLRNPRIAKMQIGGNLRNPTYTNIYHVTQTVSPHSQLVLQLMLTNNGMKKKEREKKTHQIECKQLCTVYTENFLQNKHTKTERNIRNFASH